MWQYVTLGQISKTIVYKDIALEYFLKHFRENWTSLNAISL